MTETGRRGSLHPFALNIEGPSYFPESLADALARVGIPCFGASAAAARIETSKAFMKGFAQRHGLPTGP